MTKQIQLTEKDIARFWLKVDVRGADECWLWKAGLHNEGYGLFQVRADSCKAHRVSFLIHNGFLPEDVHHNKECAKACCNPNHLHAMSHKEHMALTHAIGQVDYTKIQRSCGEENHFAKLTPSQVDEIISLRKQGVLQRVIGKMFGIHQSHVSNIERNKNWRR